MKPEMKTALRITFPCIFALVLALCCGCGVLIDNSQVPVNTYSVDQISSPVDKSRGGIGGEECIECPAMFRTDRKVNIGHDIPIDIQITADYDDKNVPVQFYLLNMDDLEEVDNGSGLP